MLTTGRGDGVPKRITNQKELQRAARAVRFCYLCGKDLPAAKNSQAEVVQKDEHVLPVQIYGPAPPLMRDRWRLVLPVHAACEDQLKQGVDEVAGTMMRMGAATPGDWSSQDFAIFGKNFDMSLTELPSGHVPTISGGYAVSEAVWSWIRGLHAALYGEYLAPDVTHLALPPVPTVLFQEDGTPEPESGWPDEMGVMCLRLVEAAHFADCWDGMTAWGEAVRYFCTWRVLESGKVMCFWTLCFPGTLEWSGTVRTSPRPWCGSYAVESLPHGAGTITQGAIDQYIRWQQLCKNSLPPRAFCRLVPWRRRGQL